MLDPFDHPVGKYCSVFGAYWTKVWFKGKFLPTSSIFEKTATRLQPLKNDKKRANVYEYINLDKREKKWPSKYVKQRWYKEKILINEK